MAVTILLFILGLVLLIKGGDWFVDGSVGIARRFHVPEILIGATVVSIGTTLPEVLVSAGAAVSGQSQLAYGNAIGSVICNTALIAAISAALLPGPCERKSLKLPVIFFFMAAGVYSVAAYIFGTFSRATGIILLAIFAAYMFLTVKQAFGASNAPDVTNSLPDSPAAEEEKAAPSVGKSVLLLIIGAAMIAFGADLLIDNGTLIAQACGVPQSVIGLTIIAIGTSLPEFITAITSIRKKHGALSVGNVIGANVFNLVLVSGLAVTLSPFDVPAEKQILGMNASFVLDLPVMWAVMLIFTLPALIKNKISRAQGIILLAIYAAFLTVQLLF